MSLNGEQNAFRVFIYIPTSLRHTSRTGLKADQGDAVLFGWCLYADPSRQTIVIAVAGAVQARQTSECGLSHSDTVLGHERACLLGAIAQKGRGASEGSPTNQHGNWLQLERVGSCTYIRSLRLLGANQDKDITLVEYHLPRPDRMRYLALEPMSLPLASPSLESASRFRLEAQPQDKADQLRQEKLEQLILLDPVRFADLTHKYDESLAPGEGFRLAIHLINSAHYFDASVKRKVDKNGTEKPHLRSTSPFSPTWRRARKLLAAARNVLHLEVSNVTLARSSASLHQLSLRVGQLLVWPSLAKELRLMRLKEQEPVSTIAPRYTALYNGVWLVANDLIMGQAVGTLLCEHHKSLSALLRRHMQPILITFIIDAIKWLDSWPLGVKLNTPLSRFFCDMFAGMTDVLSKYGLERLLLNENGVLEATVYAGGVLTRIFGLSMALCLAIDFLRLVTVHLTVFYYIQQKIYAFFCSSIVSLFHLFRGKRRNPLRNMRVDHATYELDQLLLGTLFFTLLSFLWLTVATYYAFFASTRFALIVTIAILQALLAFVNHLPLFALMLRCKDPSRLPGGVAFQFDWQRTRQEQQHDQQGQRVNCLYATLVNVPLSFADILRGHHQHLQGIRNLPRLALNVLIGRRI